jgi:hypothetical protein
VQLGLHADDLVDYATREKTRYEHLAELPALYGVRAFSGRGARELKGWRFREAELAVSTRMSLVTSLPSSGGTRTVLPATSTMEWLSGRARLKPDL